MKLVQEIKDKTPYKLDKLLMKLRLLPQQDWKPIDKTFIVSTGRTGTKFFARFLNQFSGVYANHEPDPDFLRLAINFARGRVGEEKARKTIERNRRALCKEVKRKKSDIYVESNNRLFSLLEPLTKVFADYKIVHIVRDGRDYVRSGMSRNWYSDRDSSSRLQANYFPDDPYYDQWEEMSRFAKICWRWQKKDGFIWDWVKQQEKDKVITVKFEDIFKTDDYRGIYQIGEYIGLPKKETEQMIDKMMNRKVNSTKSYAIRHWTDWGEERIKIFKEIAGEHMNTYYDYQFQEESNKLK